MVGETEKRIGRKLFFRVGGGGSIALLPSASRSGFACGFVFVGPVSLAARHGTASNGVRGVHIPIVILCCLCFIKEESRKMLPGRGWVYRGPAGFLCRAVMLARLLVHEEQSQAFLCSAPQRRRNNGSRMI